jgi:hypothetical protein
VIPSIEYFLFDRPSTSVTAVTGGQEKCSSARIGGSGTTLITAERAGRQAKLIELDPRYVDVIVQRWQQATGGEARRLET